MDDLSQKAISAALSGEWEKALQLNLELLSSEEENPDVLNRICRCFSEIGKIPEAKKYALRVLKIDPYNTIAKKALDRLKILHSNGQKNTPAKVGTINFLEEAGKTKIVPLRNLCPTPNRLALDSSEEVKLIPHPHSVTVVTTENKYIGKLPDDIAIRLTRFIKAGNEYQAFVKCANALEVRIFIREVRRAPSIAHIPSFSTEKFHYIAFTAPELVHNQKSVNAKSSSAR